MNRRAVVGVVAAVVVAALLFEPVLGPAAVLWPSLGVAACVYAVEELILRQLILARWRVPTTVVLGVLAMLVTVPGAARDPAGLWQGALSGWRRTLETSWPAQADPRLIAFVPTLVLLGCLVGVRLLPVSPPWALAPAVVVAGVAQAYVTTTGVRALLAGLALAGCAAAVLGQGDRPRRLVASGLAMLAGAAVFAVALPSGHSAVHLAKPSPLSTPMTFIDPLDEVADRLRHPDAVVFTDRTSAPVDRWPLVVLDGFDGSDWSVDGGLEQLGRALPADPDVTVPVRRYTAEVRLVDRTGPWLPSQSRTVSVSGASPLVDPASGTLFADPHVPTGYALSWAQPQVAARVLATAGVDSTRSGGSDLRQVPRAIRRLARSIAGDLPPSFRTALLLDQYLRTHYRLAVGPDLPVGHGYPQLEDFLLQSRRGTSEQFASAYVVLARVVGIPARLVVGFRQPAQPARDGAYVVRNGDALAWPEVAVAGVGWVALDPTGEVSSPSSAALAAAAARARAGQARPDKHAGPRHAAVARPTGVSAASRGRSDWWVVLLVVVVALALAWIVGVPLAKLLRQQRRRRHGSIAAWAEIRDLLRDHGVVVRPAMTPRDLARATQGDVSRAIARLAPCLDAALFTAGKTDALRGPAWQAVAQVRRALADGPRWRRVQATFSPRGLFGPLGATSRSGPRGSARVRSRW